MDCFSFRVNSKCINYVDEILSDEALSTPMAIIAETTVPSVVSSDASSSSSESVQQDPSETEPVRDATTIVPIEPVDSVTEDEAPAQADQPTDAVSQTVPPTEASEADDKIETGPSTTSSVSG